MSDPSSVQQPGRLTCVQKIGGLIMMTPVFFFMWELHPGWVDVTTHQSEAMLNLHWPRWLYYVVSGLCGAVGGAMLGSWDGNTTNSYLPGVVGGAVTAVCTLGCEDFLLGTLRYTNSILVFLAMMVGVIPGAAVYDRLRKFTENSPYYQQPPQQSVQLATYSAVSTQADVV